jgi:hypothetical protein
VHDVCTAIELVAGKNWNNFCGFIFLLVINGKDREYLEGKCMESHGINLRMTILRKFAIYPQLRAPPTTPWLSAKAVKSLLQRAGAVEKSYSTLAICTPPPLNIKDEG